MITGHLGVAAGAHAWRPRTSFWWMLAASLAPDALDVAYALARICNPTGLYSHTIPAAVLLGASLAGIAWLTVGSRTAIGVFAMVLAHPLLDWFTGLKLYWPGGELHGLGLYARPALDLALELPIFLTGAWLVRRRLPPAPRRLLAVAVAVLIIGHAAVLTMTWLHKPSGCEELGGRAVGRRRFSGEAVGR